MQDSKARRCFRQLSRCVVVPQAVPWTFSEVSEFEDLSWEWDDVSTEPDIAFAVVELRELLVGDKPRMLAKAILACSSHAYLAMCTPKLFSDHQGSGTA